MIVIVGANAKICSRIIPFLNDNEIVLVGRSQPKYLEIYKDDNKTFSFIETNYLNPSKVTERIPESEKVTIIFAGIDSVPTLMVNLNEEQIAKELLLNINFSVVFVSQILQRMINKGFGRFLFFGSKESTRGVNGGAIYSIIKQAQIGLSRSIAVEYARFGITSNTLQLGLLNEGYSKNLPPKEIEKLKSRIPVTGELDYKDIALQINLLISAISINGTIIDIDQAVR